MLGALKLSGKARSGRLVRFRSTLSKDAALTVGVARLTQGRRSGKRCTAKARSGARCTIATSVGSLTAAGKAGALTITIPAKLRGRKLPPGRYRVTVRATDDGGRRAARSTTFAITG